MNYFEYLGIKIYLSDHKIGHWLFFHGNEFWKDVPQYEGGYQVSTKGRIINIKWNRIVAPFDRKKGTKEAGYRTVHLASRHLGKRIVNHSVHYLVMLTFVGPRPKERPIIHHKNFNKGDNSIGNLEYCDQGYNRKQDFISGNMSFKGEKNNMSKMSEAQVKEILCLKGQKSYSKIGKIYGMSVSGISSIMSKRTWSYIQTNQQTDT